MTKKLATTQLIDNEDFTGNGGQKGDTVELKNYKKNALENDAFSRSSTLQNSENFEKNPTELKDPISELLHGENADDFLIRAEADLFRRSFKKFVREFIPSVMVEKCIWGDHMDVICDKLQDITWKLAKREPIAKDLILNLPPGLTKSIIGSVLWPVYCWVVDDTISIITASHSAKLANDFSDASRQLIKSEHFKKFFPHIVISKTQDGIEHYATTRGGSRFATSSQSSPTGRHAILIILDDVLSRDMADSELERNTVNKWYSASLTSRKNMSHGIIVLIMQRLHQEDLTGYLLESNPDGHELICLPVEQSPKIQPQELSYLYTDGILKTGRITKDFIEKRRIGLTPRVFETQYNQDPQSDEAAILKSEMFPIVSMIKFQELLAKHPAPTLFYGDTAYTEKTSNDPSAILACVVINNIMYITNVTVVWMEFPKLVEHFKKWTRDNEYGNGSKIVIEPKGSGISIVQQLKNETLLNIVEGKSPKAGKIERLNAISNIISSGRVCLVENKTWNNKFLDECTMGNPRHDDQRDCLVLAVENLLVKNSNGGKANYGVIFY